MGTPLSMIWVCLARDVWGIHIRGTPVDDSQSNFLLLRGVKSTWILQAARLLFRLASRVSEVPQIDGCARYRSWLLEYGWHIPNLPISSMGCGSCMVLVPYVEPPYIAQYINCRERDKIVSLPQMGGSERPGDPMQNTPKNGATLLHFMI